MRRLQGRAVTGSAPVRPARGAGSRAAAGAAQDRPRSEAGLRAPSIAAFLVLSLPLAGAHGQQGDGTTVEVTTHVVKPAKVDATPERIASLKLPEGFTVSSFASGLKNPRMLAVTPEGRVYVTRREQGDVLMLEDADGDGRADGAPMPVAHRSQVHGIALQGNRMYLATVKEIFAADLGADGRPGALEMIVGDLPDGGQHPNRTLAFGPDGMLYVSVGSTCNACNESNPEHAAMLRMSPDGKRRTIVATGLRNTIGFGWHPESGELWGMDHGIDYLGDEDQPEELNRIERGRQYGWPHVWGDGGINPQSTPPGGLTKEQWRDLSTPMVLGYTAHAAPMQLQFYPLSGGFPDEYRGDAFIAMRGSWNRQPPSGYEIARIRFEGGRPAAIEPFLTGFLSEDGKTHFGRPTGLAVMPDGALLVSDDANGALYRIVHEGADAGSRVDRQAGLPADAMLAQAAQGSAVPLASARPEMRTDRKLTVSSPQFTEGALLPPKFSEYADGVSPPLEWEPVEGAQSYAVIVEDPDSKPVTPFVHWLIWNIPAGVTSLPEGLQEQLRLTEPEGVLQGRTTRGMVAWYGPRPPAGDPPHRYQFQVFALDRLLDVPPGAERDELLAAMQGHVIAAGVLTGRYGQAVQPPK